MTQIRLSDDLSINAVEYASRANAILGIRDSGKTYTGTLIAEQLFIAGIPFFAFDPIGRWRFLRVNGLGDGIPVVVAGGSDPDLSLTPENAPKLIRAAMKAGVSMVIDLYSVGLSKADWRKIVRSSIETILYENEGHGQRHVFLEEAAEFIPQHVRDGQTYAAVEKLARMGGNVGCGLTLINQRAEEVNKAVLELCDNLLLHRQRGKNSLLSLRKWLDAGNVKPPKEITDSLADLPTGQCWAWFREVGKPRLITVAKKRSFDPNRRTMAVMKVPGHQPARADVRGFVAEMKALLDGKPASTKTQPQESKEKDVKESEARALRETNERLAKTVSRLDAMLRAALGLSPSDPLPQNPAEVRAEVANDTAPDAPTATGNMNEIVEAVLMRARKDDVLLRAIAARPELEVRVTRQTIEVDGSTLRGQLAILISESFFDETITANAAFNELKRRGRSIAVPSVYRECDKLAEMGFLTKESSGYRAVSGMKVNIIEA